MSRAAYPALTCSPVHANVHATCAVDGQWSPRRMPRGRGTDITQHDFPDELARHRPSLERSALRLCRNRHDAEDLVQTTLERAWQARAQFIPGGNLGGWLFRILCNRHLDTVRRRGGVQVPLPDEVPAQVPEDEEISSLLTLPTEQVLEALQQLPPELRAPLELMAVRGKRYREIAEELSVPINTVGTRIRRARQMLQDVFAAKAPRRQGGGR
jgi:RNA polymerase sigma-70 factor, ECF subfamily